MLFFAFTDPYLLRAFASHATRFFFDLSFLHALSARASFCARVRLFVFGQPVILIGVLRLIFTPFCATNSVGIASFEVQRFPFAASAELGTLRQRQFESADGNIGDRLERAGRDTGFADERITNQVHRDAIAL